MSNNPERPKLPESNPQVPTPLSREESAGILHGLATSTSEESEAKKKKTALVESSRPAMEYVRAFFAENQMLSGNETISHYVANDFCVPWLIQDGTNSFYVFKWFDVPQNLPGRTRNVEKALSYHLSSLNEISADYLARVKKQGATAYSPAQAASNKKEGAYTIVDLSLCETTPFTPALLPIAQKGSKHPFSRRYAIAGGNIMATMSKLGLSDSIQRLTGVDFVETLDEALQRIKTAYYVNNKIQK